MASVTWPPRVTAAPISSSVKVARARPGTAAARRPMRAARTGAAVVDIGRKRTKWGTVTSTAVIGSRRHARRLDDPRAHPRLPVRTGWARAGALPRQRLQPGRPALRRAAGAPAADRRGRRWRPALPAPPRRGASGRLRGGRHAARPRPRAAQRQSVLPGTPPDLLLSGGTQPANAQPQAIFPVNFSYITMNNHMREARAAIIAELNDAFRETGQGGTVHLTSGVWERGTAFVAEAVRLVQS